MPTLRYALEPNGPKRLELAWEGQYRNFVVKLDDQVIGQVAGQKALSAGHTLPLPDGSSLTLKTTGSALANELRVLRNGQPVPGSASDPTVRLRNTYQIIFFIAGVNLVLGLLGGLLRPDILRQLGVGWGTFMLGAVYLLLGLLVRQRRLLALVLTLVFYGLETVMGQLVPLLSGSGQNVAGLLVSALFLWGLYQGLPAIRQLRRTEAPAGSTGAS
jgi:hypothetical protein